MMSRLLSSAAVFTLCAALCGCDARPQPDGGTGGGSGGSGGSGGAGGSGGSGGSGGDGGTPPETIAAARAATFPAHVNLKGVVVTAVDFAARSTSSNCAGLSTNGVNATFWVADPANPQRGIYVDKYRCDADPDYFPVVGDVLDIEGIVTFESWYEERIAYRVILKSQFTLISGKTGTSCTLADTPPCQPLIITKKSTMSPLNDNTAPNGFGNAQGGTAKANPEYAGSRVYIPGPLTLTNPNPSALKRVTANANDSVHFGFEVTGGVLVNNAFTYGTQPDGGPGCDWRRLALDGGTDGGGAVVTFPSGIRGVWDTYSHTPCADGGTDYFRCFKSRGGYVPGTPDANFTNVLYPMNCAVDLAGQAQ